MNTPPKIGSAPALSVILPLGDAEAVLPALGDALYAFLDSLGRSYEVVFVGHGRGERSATLLHQQYRLRPDVTRVLLGRGQSSAAAATLAGLIACQGQRIITLSLDPGLALEAIGKVLDLLDVGHDFVAGKRSLEALPAWWSWLAKAEHGLHARLGGMGISDPDCGVFGFSRELVDILVTKSLVLPPELVPDLAFRLAREPVEVMFGYPSRESRLILSAPRSPAIGSRVERLYRHLNSLIGPSSWVLQAFAILAMAIALMSLGSGILLAIFSLLLSGHEALGLMLGLFLTGMGFFGLGLFAVYLKRLSKNWQGIHEYTTDIQLLPKSTSSSKDSRF